MVKKDIALTMYFQDEERYADLINGFIFDGEPVVEARDISEKDAAAAGIIRRLKTRLPFRKYRDLIRRVALDTDFVLIGLENQDAVHYAMPVRVMMMDAAGYDEQLRKIQKMHRRKQDLKGAEYLSGFGKGDRIRPVITIVLYYGREPWDGARDLYSLMGCSHLPDKLRHMLNNYRIHVLEIRDFQHLSRFRTDLYQVFGFLQRAGDKQAEKEFTLQNQDMFSKLEEDAYDVIAALSGSKELEDAKDRYREEGGTVNMCEAIKGMIEDGRLEGLKDGLQNGLKEGQLKKSRIAARNMFLRGMSPEDAAAICEEDTELVRQWFQSWKKE